MASRAIPCERNRPETNEPHSEKVLHGFNRRPPVAGSNSVYRSCLLLAAEEGGRSSGIRYPANQTDRRHDVGWGRKSQRKPTATLASSSGSGVCAHSGKSKRT